jgi:sulfate transport system ATP-binding protein
MPTARVPTTILRIIDRMQARRVVAMSESGRMLELDVEPETVLRAGDRGHVAIRKARVFAAG